MSGEFKKEKIGVEMLGDVAGGTAVDVALESKCCKPEKFTVLESKRAEWESEGCPKKCKHCWYLMHDFKKGYICRA